MEYYKLNEPDASYQIFDKEALVINLKTGKYYSLQNVAGDIFKLLLTGNTVQGCKNKIGEAYKVDVNSIFADIDSLIKKLIEEEIVTPSAEQQIQQDIVVNLITSSEYTVPVLEVYDDMQDLLLIDPIHEVDTKKGWPNKKGE